MSRSSHACGLAGDSPNDSATWAWTSFVTIQPIHRYMQLGCLAWADIIQVSAQPVMPSLGTVEFTFTPEPRRVLTWYGQVVPMIVEPFVKLSISSVYAAQNLPTSGRWSLSSWTAASNWGWVSS